MASSVFIESSCGPKSGTTEAIDGFDEEVTAASSDSNLVVVYGKNGINIDQKGLKTLVEEKSLSSISVIRIVSPTPSMLSEEEESAKRQEMEESDGSSDGDAGTDDDEHDQNDSSNEGDNSAEETEERSSDEHEGDDSKSAENLKSKKSKKFGKHSTIKLQKFKRKGKKERPEIMGLTVEQFYPTKYATEMAKEALRKAGISTFKHTADYKFQLYVIKNDHCYTPFTSQEHMEAVLAEKAESEKAAAAAAKQVFAKKKQQQPPQIEAEGKIDTMSVKDIKDKVRKHRNDLDESIKNDDDIHTSANEEGEEDEDGDFTSSEESAESDNDRDSDLDFNVNNRKGRKPKFKLLKKVKRISNAKTQNKRRLQSQDDGDETSPVLQRTKGSRSISSDTGRPTKATTTLPFKPTPAAPVFVQKPLSAAIAALPPIPKKIPASAEIKTSNPFNPQHTPAIAVRRGPIVQVGTPTKTRSALLQTSPQTVKEIVINKVMASPKGGFTDISALLAQTDSPATPTTPTSSTRAQIQTTPSSKGFMPLGVDSAAKNRLPAQISIQTHQSSSELAAEQFDLIDSIVQDEMQKSGIIEQAASANETIPQLVKMLESTEKALESNKMAEVNNFTPAAAVEDIDISNAPLLETPEDEIPDELLQHVVKLMEDDKSLQEAVEKQMFGEDSSETVSGVVSTTTPPPLAPIFHQTPPATAIILQQPILPKVQPKSIIEMTITNDTVNALPITASTSRMSGIYTPKTAPLVRKEPIQIVRGNGRVITLPPIEAPTTRAKRRAQAQHTHQGANISSILNDSSLDSSLQSNASFTGIADTSLAETVLGDAVAKRRVSKEGSAAASAPAANRSAKKSAAKKSTANKVLENVSKNEADISESQEDDDDPNRLWCLCRMPHSNRFMICCDVCEDWFHGNCVNITKSMGLEMEQKGIDWTCPKCVKKQEEKKQRKITDMLKKAPAIAAPLHPYNETAVDIVEPNAAFGTAAYIPNTSVAPPKKQFIEIKKIQSGQFISLKNLEQSKKSPVAVATTVAGGAQKKLFTTIPSARVNPQPTSAAIQPKRVVVLQKVQMPSKLATVQKSTHQQQQQQQIKVQKAAEETTTQCIMCKKAALPNSIYCSDECIRKHIQNALNAFLTKPPEPSALSPQPKSAADDKKKKAKGLFEDLLCLPDRKPKAERVNVFERKSGRFLTGSSAPTTLNLKKWLQDNPTFEIVHPGSPQAIEIEKKQKQRGFQFPSPIINKIGGNTSFTIHQSTGSPTPHSPTKAILLASTPTESTVLPKPVKQLVDEAKQSTSHSRPTTPKQLKSYPQQVGIKADKITSRAEAKDDSKTKTTKRQSTESSNKKYASESASTPPSTDSEPIRLNVRRTLKDQLLLRNDELTAADNANNTSLSLSAQEIEEFVTETEAEMYNYFNRDTGAKYKAKYRSLMFNIKDKKNQTLITKICAKLVEPKQLVRMSPEELASQELAQWREKEAKHQLEMIKKSELDLLSCAKNYVLKTHKGEEVIEGKSTDCVNLDLTTPVEDVVSVLNNSTANSSGLLDESSASFSGSHKDYSYFSKMDTSSSTYHVESYYSNAAAAVEKSGDDKSKSSSKEKDKDRGRDRAHAHDREKRHRSKDRHRDKSRSRKRSRSHSRSRSRSRERRHKSSHKDDRRDREERDRERDRGRGQKDHTKEREHKEDSEKRTTEKKTSLITASPKVSQGSAVKERQRENTSAKKPPTPKPLETFSLIDQILESTKTIEEAANIVSEKGKEPIRQPSPPPPMQPTPTLPTPTHTQTNFIDGSQEPNNPTNSISTPPHDPYVRYTTADALASNSDTIWGGNINMIDVASFQIILQPVVGNSLNLGKQLQDELDVVGRIGPDTVWDYISKIKKSPNKEIVIIRLVPSSEAETAAYTILYQYLDKRKRLGVIKTLSPEIKDFYIFPLGAGRQMPSILQIADRVDFYEDSYRPDMLVGIVIRVIGKRMQTVTSAASTMTTSSTAKFSRRANDADSLTPPGSPKRKKRPHSAMSKDEDIDIDAIIKAPITAKAQKTAVVPAVTMDDADEPYSPGGSSDDDVPLLPGKSSTILDAHEKSEDDLKRKMDELNRQIAAQEMEIAGLLNVEPSRYASSSGAKSTVLANISIPSNLSQILASIKGKPEPPPMPSSTRAPTQTSAPPPPRLSGSKMVQMSATDADEEYNPEDAISTSYESTKLSELPSSSSRLAQLSEAELLSMVPDDMINQPPAAKKSRYEEPPPPGV